MQANDFEKKVQHLMDEFKIRPSEGVWLNVEERIREKKVKRRILFFILFSFIGLSLAGYGIYNYSYKQNKRQSEIILLEKTRQKENNHIDPTASTKTALVKRPTSDGKEATSNTDVTKLSVNSVKVTSKQGSNSESSIGVNQRLDEKFTAEPANSTGETERQFSKNEPRVLPIELNHKIETGSISNDIAIVSLTEPRLVKILENNVKQEKSTANNEKAIRVNSKLQWGINFSAGSSVITNNRLSLKNSTAASDAAYNSPGSSSGAGSGRLPELSNEAVFAFRLGLVVKKQVSLRSNLSTGLQYAYLGDKIKAATTATPVLSQLFSSFGSSSYYRAVPQKTYEGHFHFIEAPLLYHWRMSKNDKHFLSLTGGASIGYLLATNALTYDTSFGGIYHHDKSLFTKTHFNLISGVSYHVRGNMEWSIGPQFSFDLTRMTKADLDQRKYFLYAGIDTRIFFQSRKKK